MLKLAISGPVIIPKPILVPIVLPVRRALGFVGFGPIASGTLGFVTNAFPVLNCTKIELKNIGKKNIEISTTGFNNLMLWTEVNTMICIEPITQYTSYVEQKYLNKHMQLSQGKNIFTVEIKVI